MKKGCSAEIAEQPPVGSGPDKLEDEHALHFHMGGVYHPQPGQNLVAGCRSRIDPLIFLGKKHRGKVRVRSYVDNPAPEFVPDEKSISSAHSSRLSVPNVHLQILAFCKKREDSSSDPPVVRNAVAYHMVPL